MLLKLRLKSEKVTLLPAPAIMGVVNVSPDSFFMPHKALSQVLKTVENMVAAGVHIIDVGGQATNPNVDIANKTPSEYEELDRVAPVIESIRKNFGGLISVDTSKANVMRAAIEVGADIINDQQALIGDGAMRCAVEHKVPVVLMHSFGASRIPGSTTKEVLLSTVQQDLQQRVETCLAAGISKDRIILDPGFGQGHFGKDVDENFFLLAKLPVLSKMGYPLLSGWSRKSMIGDVLGGVPVSERLLGTTVANSMATFLGASILRVHDVKAATDLAKMFRKLQQFN